MSTEREDAEVALIKARTSLAKTCDIAVVALYLFACAFGGFTFAGVYNDRIVACEFWRSVESKCHDDACLLQAASIRPWSCGPDARSFTSALLTRYAPKRSNP